MDQIRGYRDLLVWQKAMLLVTSVYEITQKYPTSEQFTLTSQTRRSAISVPSNIAEGYGRNSTNDYVRFLRIACGSLYEVQTQIEIAVNLNCIPHTGSETIFEKSEEIVKMIGALINKVENSRR
jgi:four helix bundle protein